MVLLCYTKRCLRVQPNGEYTIIMILVGFPFSHMSQVQCGEIEVEKKIDEKIDQFISWIEKHPNKKSQVYSDSK